MSNTETATSNMEKAELLNRTFAQHFNSKQPPLGPTDIPSVNPDDLHVNILCSEEEVYELLCSLDTTKASGSDNISAHMLKKTALSITEAITTLFNISITLGELPDEWKVSHITPIPKPGDHSNPSNYRPISLLSILSKLLEKHVANLLTKHIQSHSPLSSHQWGFSRGKSTTGALLTAVDHWLRLLEEGVDICAVFLDYRKAFDTVPHRNLLEKLKFLGVNSYLLKWLTHYLCKRYQAVCVNGSTSDKLPVVSGVPQGSVLGPVLFIIYVNDITCIPLMEGNMSLFADDIMLYRPVRNATDYAILQSDIDKISVWTESNYLQFNAQKCKYMTISRKQYSCSYSDSLPALSVNGVALEKVDNYKHLGIWITSTLSWYKQVSEVCRKARQKVGILFRKYYQHASTSTLLQLYLSCIRPDLEYAVAVWSPHQKCLINSLEAVQKFALRVCSKQWDANYHTLLARYNIPSLFNRRQLLRLCFLFNVLNGTYSLPDPSPIELRQHNHYSRSHHLTLKVPYAHSNAYYHSFFCDTPRHWNSLPLDIVASSNSEHFKRNLSLYYNR